MTMLSTLALIQEPSAGAAGDTSTIDVSWTDLGLTFGLILMAIAISRWQRLELERGLLVGAVRAFVQLAAVGYILVYIFAADEWWLVLLALFVMLISGAIAAARRARGRAARDERRVLLGISGASMLIGSGLTLAYVTQVVLQVEPWYEPRYLLPLFGMIVGNSMNGASLAAERLASELDSHRGEVEAYLALGATSATAAAEPVRRAMAAALIPTINGLMTVGLVSLPGMMIGQILAGESPLLAIRYQIVVMFMLAGATALTTVLVVLWYRRTFFTASEQLAVRVRG